MANWYDDPVTRQAARKEAFAILRDELDADVSDLQKVSTFVNQCFGSTDNRQDFLKAVRSGGLDLALGRDLPVPAQSSAVGQHTGGMRYRDLRRKRANFTRIWEVKVGQLDHKEERLRGKIHLYHYERDTKSHESIVLGDNIQVWAIRDGAERKLTDQDSNLLCRSFDGIVPAKAWLLEQNLRPRAAECVRAGPDGTWEEACPEAQWPEAGGAPRCVFSGTFLGVVEVEGEVRIVRVRFKRTSAPSWDKILNVWDELEASKIPVYRHPLQLTIGEAKRGKLTYYGRVQREVVATPEQLNDLAAIASSLGQTSTPVSDEGDE